MMKNLLTIFLVVVSYSVMAQGPITGKVTSSDDGSSLPGVNVLLKGTLLGSVTDLNGNYSIEAPTDATLVFSFIGFNTQEVQVAGRSVIDISMTADVKQLSEVVVTALGIERNRNELAYAAQQVSGDQISQTRNTNFVNSLSGKVSGLDVKQSNTMGGSTNVIIRGYKSITQNNQALFVIDGVPVSNANTNSTAQRMGQVGTDYGNAAADINPDNIASVNVLKGAAATALYGSRAANGVVMITTKKGRKNSFDVLVNSGVTWGKIDKSTFPTYQREYGGGYFDAFRSATFDDGTLPAVRFDDDASYGPKFDPTLMVYQWNALDPFSPNYHKATPWVAARNDPSTFYETAISSNQSISISAGGEKATVKFAYTRSDEKGVLPNSTLDKNMFNMATTYEVLPKLTVGATANYSRVVGVGRYGTGYQGLNPNQGFRQWWQTNVDIKELSEAYFRNRKNVTWNWANLDGTNPIYANNPYWNRYENYSNDARDHYFGYVTANYRITDWLDILGRVSVDATNDMQEERNAVGSVAIRYNYLGTLYSQSSMYTRFDMSFTESNYDLLLNFNKKITEDISLKGVLGSNMRRSRLNAVRNATNGGLVVPGLYSLSNSASALFSPIENYERIGVDGIFAEASLTYKDLINVDLSARNDKSTTLPAGNNSYFYYSAAGNFVFSNVINALWLSHGKLRVNYAEVGNDAPALSTTNVYDKPPAFGNLPIFLLPTTKANSDLKSERTKSLEAGIELEFLEGRLGFDFTAYQTRTFDQVIPVNITAATGYTSKWINSGEMENKGIEISAFLIPVKRPDFLWRMNLNFTANRNKVVSLYGEGDNKVLNYSLLSPQGGISLNAGVGQPYGIIRGTDFVYTNGQKTVGSNGYYLTTSRSDVIIGNPNPDWLGGINNIINYKNVTLSFLVDIRRGGDVWSLDQWYGEATGLYPNSAGLNELGVEKRAPVAEGGGILLPGVKEDGSPNDIRAENLNGDGLTPFGYAANDYAGAPRASAIYDGSYVKLRELTLTYSLPQNIIEKLRAFKSIDVSLVGRNLWIIKKKMKYSDPEDGLSSGNTNQGYQSGAYPMVRTYGFNVQFGF
jgi:TonB-linked SusC/RagA family outer membrane protein